MSYLKDDPEADFEFEVRHPLLALVLSCGCCAGAARHWVGVGIGTMLSPHAQGLNVVVEGYLCRRSGLFVSLVHQQ